LGWYADAIDPSSRAALVRAENAEPVLMRLAQGGLAEAA
jgi:hypothetical protein